jgi:hypothetical protein
MSQHYQHKITATTLITGITRFSGSSGFSGIIVTKVRHYEERCSRRSNLSAGRKAIASQEALAMTMHRRFPAKVGRPDFPKRNRALARPVLIRVVVLENSLSPV